MKSIHFTLLVLMVSISFSQSNTLEKGRLIDSISVKNSSDESFSIYLPKAYTSNMLSAIVFIFDPGGMGPRGIKPFISSAEKFNYILICSNNTKNGPYDKNFEITNRLFAHVFAEYSIDEKQIYLAGFSGGSRLASRIAVLTGVIQGVIACGAGFTNAVASRPNLKSKFSYAGLIGDEDMNYQEMLKAKLWLNKFNIENELFIYEDGHRWTPSLQIERAFSWLELQANKRNIRKIDLLNIEKFFLESKIIADSLYANEPFKAVKEYDRIIDNYSAYFTLDSIKIKRAELIKSTAYKKRLNAIKAIERTEFKLSKKLQDKFYKESNNPKPSMGFSWWQKELNKLKAIISTNNTNLITKMAKRQQFKLFVNIYESLMYFEQNNKVHEAIYCKTLLTIIYSDKPYWYYQLAESYAKINDLNNTQQNLEKAIKNGLVDKARIKANPLFSKFKPHKKFLNFLNALDD